MTAVLHSPAAAEAVSDATVAAAKRLNVNQAELARIIGVSKPTVSRMFRGQYPLSPATKAGELALLFVRLSRSLDSIVGTDETARQWLGNPNTALAAQRPRELMQTAQGLVRVVEYLDAHRARV
jgi:putative toxin-antitoxin system antitoxin component (TIGR02293 family)